MANHDAGDVEQAWRGLTVVVAALAAGPLLFGAVAIWLGPVGELDPQLAQTLTWVSWALAASQLMTMAVLFPSMSRRIQAAPDVATKLGQFRARSIVLMAMGEGAALFAGVLILLTGETLAALPGFAALPIALLLAFPSRGRMSREVLGQSRIDAYR